jgi:hypothetical protein
MVMGRVAPVETQANIKKTTNMWAITSYFNPVGYRRRSFNYHVFRKNLDLPLVTVELGFDGKYELTNKDADVLIQIDGGAVLWQKERLLNLALKAVPADVENIAWLDCDVVFQRSDWTEEAEQRLTSLNVIQLFSESTEFKAERLHPAASTEAQYTPAIGALFAHSNLPTRERWQSVETIRPKQLGFAWAGKRALLQDQTFYDAAILGGADALMFLAMYGLFEQAINRSSLNVVSGNHYLRWAESFHKAVGQRVGYIPGKIYHLWHGDRENRKYRDRYHLLRNFDPYSDIILASSGAWQWKDPQSELAQSANKYFLERSEDGAIMELLSLDPLQLNFGWPASF